MDIKRNYLYFAYCFTQSAKRYLYEKYTGCKFSSSKKAGKRILSLEEGNIFTFNKIIGGEPFMAARYGTSELNIMIKYVYKQLGFIKEIPDRKMDSICNNAGFFPHDKKVAERYAEMMLELSGQVDLLGVWIDIMEDYIIKTYAPQSQITELPTLLSFECNNPWMAALKGKNVLVIHPFEESIRSQYRRREKLFKNQNILPEFNLLTIKAVQTIAGNKCEFATWFDALDSMLDKAAGMDFDIAIIGCGAYGFPLAAKIKMSGKQAIHLGAAVQQLFGIKSKRNDKDSSVSKFYNEYWVRPNENERPKGLDTIEGGCYW
jgi:hypothetical protein